jgi:hypothetical protein
VSKSPNRHILQVGNINTTIWQENGKVRQSGQPNLPEYLAEFKDTYEGRKQAEIYILGMVRLAELVNQQK